MNVYSLNKIIDLIHTQLAFHDKLSAYLVKTSSLSLIGSVEDFSEYSENTLQSYFWVLHDLTDAAKKANQEAQNHLFAAESWLNTLNLQKSSWLKSNTVNDLKME
jgi:hypothetical protein